MGDFSMHTVEAMHDVTYVFEVVIGFLCAIADLGVDADVVVATMAEEDLDADIMLSSYFSHATSEEADCDFMAIFCSNGFATIFTQARFCVNAA